jgi:GNAT superfamily N-acetyltransferase
LTLGQLPPSQASLAADLLAERQHRFRDAWPAAARSFESPSRCQALLEPLLRDGDAFGAWRRSSLVGFVAGTSHDRWGVVPAAGHAVDSRDADVSGVYGSLYTELSQGWLVRGVAVHDVELPAVNDIEEAWHLLGFGRRVCIGSRTSEILPSDVFPDPQTRIRVADNDDLSSIVRLAAMEIEFRLGAPMYLEGGPPDLDLLRETHAALFEAGAVHFLASVEREVVGLLTLLQESRFPPICAEDAPFVSTTATDPRYRRQGIGRMLVRVAADWARERGHEYIDVSFQSASPLLRSFWRRSGFAPVGWKVARRLPESLSKRIDHTAGEFGRPSLREKGVR